VHINKSSRQEFAFLGLKLEITMPLEATPTFTSATKTTRPVLLALPGLEQSVDLSITKQLLLNTSMVTSQLERYNNSKSYTGKVAP
jgi:hypothetical protein